MTFSNNHSADSQLFLYKRRYIPTEGHALSGHRQRQLERIHYEGGRRYSDRFPAKELGLIAMNMHILFRTGASHGYIEPTSRACLYSLRPGVYNLDNSCSVKQGDYILGAYPVGYGVGRKRSAYLFKDCNRDVETTADKRSYCLPAGLRTQCFAIVNFRPVKAPAAKSGRSVQNRLSTPRIHFCLKILPRVNRGIFIQAASGLLDGAGDIARRRKDSARRDPAPLPAGEARKDVKDHQYHADAPLTLRPPARRRCR